MALWLVVAVLVLPMAVLPMAWGIDPMQARNAVFIVVGLATVIGLLRNRWLQAFLIWAVVAFALSGMRSWGLAGLLGLFAWALLYRHASRLTEAGWRSVRWALVAAVAVQLVWMGLQVIGADPLFSEVSWRGDLELVKAPTADVMRCGVADPACVTRLQALGWTLRPAPVVGFLLNPMDASLFLGLALPLLPWWLALPTVAAILSELRATAGLAAVAITALWFALRTARPGLRRFGWLSVPVVGLGVTLYLLYVDPQGAGIKPTIWWHTLSLAWINPITGWGPNAVNYAVRILDPARDLYWNFVFNEWIQGALEVGMVGVALVLGYFGALAWRLRGHRWQAAGPLVPGVAILLAVSVFSIPLRIGPVALLGALYLGRLDGLLAKGEA